MRHRRRHPAGFTLLELVLVMLIMCIIVGMAAPSLRTFGEGRRLDNAAAEIVGLTQWARTQAISESTTYRLNIDLDSRPVQYYLTRDFVGTVEATGTEFGRTFTLPETLSIQWQDAPQHDDGAYIRFLATGRTEPSTITLSDDRGNVVVIGCFSSAEAYHVLTPDEMQSLGTTVRR